MSKIKIAIDAGHGSYTAGKRTAPFKINKDVDFDKKIDIKKGEQYREHYANVGISHLLYNKLVKRGYDVIKTGWNDANGKDDVDESLSSRQNKIKNAKCDYSISIHFNAYGDGKSFNSAKGVGIYIHNKYDEDSKVLANYVLKELIKGSKQDNRGVTGQALSLCNCKTMKTKASILVELAFMTNEYEAQELMANSKFWEECAEEVANGFENYLKSKNIIKEDKPKENKPTNTNTENIYHIVKKGETLYGLAIKYKTSISKLKELNGLKSTVLQIGQKLIVSGYSLYIVIKGDTLSKISRKTLDNANRYKEIMELNNLKSTVINIGQKLKIPNK